MIVIKSVNIVNKNNFIQIIFFPFFQNLSIHKLVTVNKKSDHNSSEPYFFLSSSVIRKLTIKEIIVKKTKIAIIIQNLYFEVFINL